MIQKKKKKFLFSIPALVYLEGKYNEKMTEYVCLDNSTLELSIYNCVCDDMINGSLCISCVSCGFIYSWNDIARINLFQKAFFP